MGALAPLPVWVPEDDILLKNAVEAGASLESLAKGAVRFSRKYTIREVQDRWHSLLYDPIVSAEACARMIEFEQSNPAKTIRGNSGGSKKRKSVRSCYYALRKRIRNEPFDPLGPHFLIAPGQSSFARDDDNCMLQDPSSSHFELKDSDMEIVKSVFPQIMIEDPVPCVDAGPCQKIPEDSIGPSFSNLPMEQDNLASVSQGNLCHDPKASPAGESNCLRGATCDDTERANSLNSSTMEPLHTFGCSSPAPVLPIWKSVEEVPMPAMPLDMTLEGKDLCGRKMFTLDDTIAAKDVGTSGCNTRIPVDELKGSAVNADNYLLELSKTLLDFTKDGEMLLVDDQAKDPPDKSYYDGLSSLLISFPEDSNPVDPQNPTDRPMSANPKVDLSSMQNSCSLDVTSDRVQETTERNDPEVPVASISDPRFPEAADDVRCCVLNTEDPDIPCNDDFLPKKSALAPSRIQRKASNNVLTASGNDFSGNQRTVEKGPSSILRETPGQAHASSQNLGNHPAGSYDLKNELADVKSFQKVDSNEGHVLGIIQDQQASDADVVVDLAEMEQLMGVNSAESEEIESDDDVPYFSDIEAMVLDLDLDPDDQESNAHTKVLRYQSEEAKRAIVRLEQGAQSYMRRDIASHGAIAVLYGRHSKHYIKKHEVLLGRRTEGLFVDIDLGREGHNKISRRQAIIKLEKDGYFLLKNLGKCGILVNNKEVSPGHSLRLCSNSLIEVRGMPFIFETNDARIKWCLENLAGK
ncbi:hypothetical protein MLD38_022227 [Melastoma candidum]|uniref:Uncharacterized protein n=1 Tax=Melastoma candidum TaxID=119954 RepID=A0ACB9QIL2_9MYRT|nr:hypothetical protein MLD38_022227 [Melastoma candidum]